MNALIPLAGLLLVLALLALWLSSRQRAASGLPEGRVIAADTGSWKRLEKPLYDAQTGLTGRPDYIVEQAGALIPVEVKSGWAPAEPRNSHLFQLAAYCLLVERSSGKRPPTASCTTATAPSPWITPPRWRPSCATCSMRCAPTSTAAAKSTARTKSPPAARSAVFGVCEEKLS